MAEPFLGQIQIVGFNFAPRGWLTCDGQLLAISQFTALFSLLGVNYGGDGRTTFGLPDLRGRIPMSFGNGPGLTPREIGEKAGTETVQLVAGNLASHTHGTNTNCQPASGNSTDPTGRIWSKDAGVQTGTYANAASNASMNPASVTVGSAGGTSPHSNIQPSLALNFVIATQGIFPNRP
jgi:microcystin-dependent protein